MNHRFALPSAARTALVVLVLAAASGAPFEIALAQSSPDETRALLDRVDRLQRDLNTLQRQVYQGGGGTSASGGGGSAPAPIQGSVATTLELRIQDLEEQVQNLRGAIEQANFQTKSVQDRLDKLSSDVDFRLGAVEKKLGISPGASVDVPQAGSAAPPSAAPVASAPGGDPQPRVLGQIPADANSTAPATMTTPPPSAPPEQKAALPPGPPKDQYAYAFGLLNHNDFANGERAFKEFLAQHPKDPLAGSAQYWLGRTYFARSNFNDAVRTFAEGYQKYPQSQHAAENLLYLGRSLAGLNRKRDACESYNRLLREYPKASGTTKASAQAERKKLACG